MSKPNVIIILTSIFFYILNVSYFLLQFTQVIIFTRETTIKDMVFVRLILLSPFILEKVWLSYIYMKLLSLSSYFS